MNKIMYNRHTMFKDSFLTLGPFSPSTRMTIFIIYAHLSDTYCVDGLCEWPLSMKEVFQHKCVHLVYVDGLTGSGGQGKTVADGTRRQSR